MLRFPPSGQKGIEVYIAAKDRLRLNVYRGNMDETRMRRLPGTRLPGVAGIPKGSAEKPEAYPDNDRMAYLVTGHRVGGTYNSAKAAK